VITTVRRFTFPDESRHEEATMALTFQVNEFGHTFATRERGDVLRRRLLEQCKGHDVVIVDFDGVTNVSYSFADEFLGKLYAEGSIQVERRNLSARVQDVVDRAVSRRAEDVVTC
jgi:hypothetical protein